MGLLEKFTKDGTQLDKDIITPYNKKTQLDPKSFQYSKLDLDNISPAKYNQITKMDPILPNSSKYDLDGKVGKKYLDNPPK